MARAYHLLLQGLAVVAAIVIGLVALLVTADVVARNVGLGSMAWVVEISEYSLPLATFFVAPWLLHKNEHVRLDVLLVAFPRRIGVWTERIADALGLAISAIFVFYAVRVILDSARIGSMVLKTLVFPEWWLFVPVPVCFALLAIEFLRRMIRGPIPEHSGPATLATQE